MQSRFHVGVSMNDNLWHAVEQLDMANIYCRASVLNAKSSRVHSS